MAPKANVLVLVPLLSLLPFSSLALTQDFCVANTLLPDTPAGYPCKPKLLVNADDFHYRGLAKPGPIIRPFNTGLASAFVKQFPAVNGLHLGATRVDVLPGGVVPLHTHPEGSELLIVIEGSMVAGFISAETNQVYIKTVNKYELFVFPQGLLHFQYNAGNTTAVAFAAYSSSNAGLQITDNSLFGNVLPADVVTKVTFIDEMEVGKLKEFFGLSAVPS